MLQGGAPPVGRCCPQSQQLWLHLTELERSHSSLRRDVEALRGVLGATSPPATTPRPVISVPRSEAARPQSMCEWRQLSHLLPRDDSGLGQTRSGHWSHVSGDYDNTLDPGRTSTALPSYPEVLAQTERITRRIQELLQSAREGNHEAFIPCTDNILQASLAMGSLFAAGGVGSQGPLGAPLRQLLESARRLQRDCHALLPKEPQLASQQLIQCAYDVAKAAKHLVVAYPATH